MAKIPQNIEVSGALTVQSMEVGNVKKTGAIRLSYDHQQLIWILKTCGNCVRENTYKVRPPQYWVPHYLGMLELNIQILS